MKRMHLHQACTNIESPVVVSEEIGLELNVDNTKYMAMSQDQNAGRSHDIKMGISYAEMVTQFKYSGTTRN
jgi:hypothetical protein